MFTLKAIDVFLLGIYFLDIFNYFLLNNRYLRQILNLLKIALIFVGILNTSFGRLDHIVISFLAGSLYLPVMIFINAPSAGDIPKIKTHFFEWFKTLLFVPKVYRAEFFTTLKEELIWRCALVYLVSSFGMPSGFIIVFCGFLFYVVHLDLSSRFVIISEMELLLFSMMLYVIYLLTGSVISVWVIHFLRNSYLKFRELFCCHE